jgi:hypothetical protein
VVVKPVLWEFALLFLLLLTEFSIALLAGRMLIRLRPLPLPERRTHRIRLPPLHPRPTVRRRGRDARPLGTRHAPERVGGIRRRRSGISQADVLVL